MKKIRVSLRQDLPDYSSFCLQMNGTNLTDSQCRIFLDVVSKLQNEDVRIVYRGDKKDRSLAKFNLTAEAMPYGFNDYIFLIGEKGRYFLRKRVNASDTKIYGISDTSSSFIEAIFDMLHLIFTKSNYAFPVKASLDKFKKDHPEIIQYFIAGENKQEFVSQITGASKKDQVRARDYYLTLLHHFGKNEFYPVSFLLSATTSFAIAQRYIAKEVMSENDLILFGWVPRGNRAILYTWTSHWREKTVIELKLPTFSRSIYHNQQEISLKGGLLAHYTLGYLYTRLGKKYFEVNPWLFKISDINWPENGFPIDQQKFDEMMKGSLYQGAFVIDANGDFGEY